MMRALNKGEQAVLREAVAWFVRIHNEEASATDFNAWQEWLMRDARHQQAFQSVEDFWQAAGSVAHPSWPLIAELGMDSYDGTMTVDQWHAARRSPQYGWRAVAAGGRKLRRLLTSYPLAAAATLVAVAGATLLLMDIGGVQRLVDSAVASTHAAQVREYRLSDGTQVTLGAKSRLSVNFTAGARHLNIDEGEAFFTVARDPRRPFVVHAGNGTITALGTAFNVRSVAGRVVVTVVEGKVEVAGQPSTGTGNEARSASRLRAGQTLAYGDMPSPTHAVDTTIATAWRGGQLKYLHEPLKFVIADVARYTDRRLLITDPRIGDVLYTGAVLPAEVDDWLTSVGESLPVDIEYQGAGTVLFKARSP